MRADQINYRLQINNGAAGRKYSFSYASTRMISVTVGRTGAVISADLTKDYSDDLDDPYISNLLKEAVRRAALIYVIRYERPFHVRDIRLAVSDKDRILKEVDLSDSLIFYQLFENKLLRPVGADLKDPAVLQSVMKYRRSKDDLVRPVSALYAYLFSKTKKKETERFTYLWIAMNGFYAAVTHVSHDRDQMTAFVKKFGLGNVTLTRNDRDNVCRLGMSRISKLPEPVTAESLERSEGSILSDFLDQTRVKLGKEKFDLTPYGFLLTDFPYYLRCTHFHAQRLIELFSFDNDIELKSLRIVNGLLEEFLDRNIHILFRNMEIPPFK